MKLIELKDTKDNTVFINPLFIVKVKQDGDEIILRINNDSNSTIRVVGDIDDIVEKINKCMSH